MSSIDPAVNLEALAEALLGHSALVVEHPPRGASYAPWPAELDARVAERLAAAGIGRPYTHQAHALEAALAGKDVLVVTGTNSGKTLCYNGLAVHQAFREPSFRALYVFPTKALAQDQLSKVQALLPKGCHAATYDGDTPQAQRTAVRRGANVVLTNPDMLHVGILPRHDLWGKFLRSLSLIVLDEVHVYRGVFGSHAGNVVRRLLRLCEFHGSRPRIVACSATIGNPEELYGKLTGRHATLIDEDGSPSAKRSYVFFNPPSINEVERMSSNVVSAQMLATLAETGLRGIAFCRSRITTELVLQYARRYASEGGKVPATALESYRSGYTPKERRELEQAVFSGQIMGLAATNALELGVDIGGLDAVVMNGYPGSVAAFRQQAGRAGRGSRPGMAILVAQNEPLEQFLVREPHRLLEASPERVALHPENPQILAKHLLCAAQENPLQPTELGRFGSSALAVAEGLDLSGELQLRGGRFFYPSNEPPANKTNIRGSIGDEVRLYVGGELLGTMERWRALERAHVGAIYLHRGSAFRVIELDLELSRALLEPFQGDYFTEPLVQSTVDEALSFERKRLEGGEVGHSAVRVTDLVGGFRRRRVDGGGVLDVQDLSLPPTRFDTLAVRVNLDHPGPQADFDELIGGVHGVEHALMAVAPLFAGCDRADLGSAWYSASPDTLAPTVFVFDRAPGGVGLTDALFGSFGDWSRASLQMLESCSCVEGCPSCLLSPHCESFNEALHKGSAMRLLRSLATG